MSISRKKTYSAPSLHDKGLLQSCCRRCKSISACTMLRFLCSRVACKKAIVQSTPCSVSQRACWTNTSLHAFQSAAFAICSPVIHPPSFSVAAEDWFSHAPTLCYSYTERSHTLREDHSSERRFPKTSKDIASKIRDTLISPVKSYRK